MSVAPDSDDNSDAGSDGAARAVADLIATVSVTDRGEDRFEGVGSTNDGVDATYGGHMVAQALSAASSTVDDGRPVHSLHGYFLRAGRPGTPFRLDVDRVRDGRTFCARRVRVRQAEDGGGGTDDGPVLFEMMASFTTAVDVGDRPELRSSPPPDFESLPDPGALPTHHQLMGSLDELPLPEEWAMRNYGLDVRTVNAPWCSAGPSADQGIRLWIRAAASFPSDHRLQAAVMAYQSDESLADNIAVPWGRTWGAPGVVFVSLDHAMWFHRPFDLNDWHLLEQRPVTVAAERGLATASVYDRSGRLVVSTRQEALLRLADEAVGQDRPTAE